MNETDTFALIVIAGTALLICGLEDWLVRRRNKKRLMKIVMCAQSCDEQEKRDAPLTPAQRNIALHEQRG